MRQYLHLYAAALIVAALSACAPVRTALDAREGRALLRQTQQLARQGDFEAAAHRSEEALARSPQAPPGDAALFSLGLIFADRANPTRDDEKALAFLTRLRNDFPQSPYAQEAAVWVPLLEEQISAERRGHALLRRAQQRASEGDFAGAEEESRALLALSPDAPPADAALFTLALIFADRGNPARDDEKALAFLTRLRNDFPQSPFAQGAAVWAGLLEERFSAEQQGRALLRIRQRASEGDYAGAEEESRALLNLSPDAGLFGLGLLFADRGNPERNPRLALEFLTQLARDFPQSPFAREAEIWARVLEDSVAVQYAGRLRPPYVQRLVDQGEFDAALREEEKALALSPKAPPADAALFSMGLIHVHFANPRKDYRKALSLLGRLTKDFPASPFAEEARTWIGILERMEQAARVDLEIEERKKELRQ